MEISSYFFFVCSLQKPIVSHWFKKVLIDLFGLSFFIKWWNSTKPFFSCMSRQYFCFFLTKIHLKYVWSTEMYFYGFCQTVWYLTGIPLNFMYISFLKKIYTYNLSILYCYQLLMLLFGRLLPGTIISHHLKTWSLGLEKDLTIWMFTI